MEDNRRRFIDRVGLTGEPFELDVPGSIDIAGVALVAFADIDHRHALGEQLAGTLRADLDIRAVERAHHELP